MAETSAVSKSRFQGKEKAFVWTDTLSRCFLELLCDYQRQNGQKNGFSWISLIESFEHKTNMKCNKDTLKNRHGNMKNQWKLWLKLKHGETGLGWDYEKQRIDAPPDRFLTEQENPDYRAFKHNGIPPEIELMMDTIYGATVATGEHCVAPSMDPSPGTVVLEDSDDFGLEVLGDDLFHDDTPATTADRIPVDSQPLTRDEGLANVDNRASCPIPSQTKSRRRGGTSNNASSKRNVRRSTGSSLYQDHIAASIKQTQAMVSLWEHEVNSVAQSSNQPPRNSSTEDSMKIIVEMISEGSLRDGSPLWCFAVSLMSMEPQREMFMLIPTNQSRLEWLRWEYKDRKGVDP